MEPTEDGVRVTRSRLEIDIIETRSIFLFIFWLEISVGYWTVSNGKQRFYPKYIIFGFTFLP